MIEHNVCVLVPHTKTLSLKDINKEPWRMETPIYSIGNSLVSIYCEKTSYFMTDEVDALEDELKKYNLPLPSIKQFRPNPALNHSTRLKMLELGAVWSVTKYYGTVIINLYTKKSGAFIAQAIPKYL